MNTSDYQLKEVLLISERLGNDIELKNNVTDLDIYESMDKPYLTGRLLLMDNEFLYEDGGILGGERMQITIESLRGEQGETGVDVKPITKVFYIDRITNNIKVQDDTSVLVIELIEDVYYHSSLQNINRFYQGKITDIATKISDNFLNKTLESSVSSRENYKLIVPNMHPLDALTWLCHRAQTTEGFFPFYLFSTFAKEELFMMDLETMLAAGPINPDDPFAYGSFAEQEAASFGKKRNIKAFSLAEADDMLTKIRKGIVGSNYQYIDAANESVNEFEFDVKIDMFDRLKNDYDLIKEPNYSSRYEYENKSFNQHRARLISQIGGAYAYRESDAEDFDLSLGESRSLAEYKTKISSRSMDNFLKSNSLSFVVDGVDFIDGNKHSTIGTLLQLIIPSTSPGHETHHVDERLSGDYLIYNAKHSFSKEAYVLTLNGVKINGYSA